MNVSSDATWMNAASNGFKKPNAASALPSVSTPMQFGCDLRNAQVAGNNLGDRACVARQENCLDSHRMDRFGCVGRFRADRVGDDDPAKEVAVPCYEDFRGPSEDRQARRRARRCRARA